MMHHGLGRTHAAQRAGYYPAMLIAGGGCKPHGEYNGKEKDQ